MKYPTFEQLMEYRGTVLKRVISLMDSNGQDAEDLTQDILVSFIKAIKKFRNDAELKTLLYIITQRRFADWLRRKYRGERRWAELTLFKIDTILEANKNISNGMRADLLAMRKTASRIREGLK